MEKLEHPGGAPFQLRVSWIPSYSSRSTKIYGAPSSGIFKDEFKSLDPPNAILCQPRPPYGVAVASPPHGGWREELSKRNPSSSRGRRRSTLMGKGGHDVSCAVILHSGVFGLLVRLKLLVRRVDYEQEGPILRCYFVVYDRMNPSAGRASHPLPIAHCLLLCSCVDR
jgi:hypothetical protein